VEEEKDRRGVAEEGEQVRRMKENVRRGVTEEGDQGHRMRRGTGVWK